MKLIPLAEAKSTDDCLPGELVKAMAFRGEQWALIAESPGAGTKSLVLLEGYNEIKSPLLAPLHSSETVMSFGSSFQVVFDPTENSMSSSAYDEQRPGCLCLFGKSVSLLVSGGHSHSIRVGHQYHFKDGLVETLQVNPISILMTKWSIALTPDSQATMPPQSVFHCNVEQTTRHVV